MNSSRFPNEKIRKAFALFLPLLMALSISFSACSQLLADGGMLANSVKEFSGVQGKHGWQYGHWDQSSDQDGEFKQGTDFKLFKYHGDDSINGLSQHSEFTTGKLWYLKDGEYYTSVWAMGGHAHADINLGNYKRANHWVVRRWTSSYEGQVSITGVAGKVMPWGENWGGGVNYQIIVDGEVRFNHLSELGDEAYSIKANLKRNSQVDFLIGPGSSIGVVNFTGIIRKTQ